KTITDMQKIAKEKNGLCLSDIYINANTKLTWKCEHGHIFDMTPSNVLNKKTWCRTCSTNKRKKTIEDMHLIANKRNGFCLSHTYINSKTKLSWKCQHGHV